MEAYFTPVWRQRARSYSKITEQFTEVCKTCNPRGENRQTFCSRNRCMQSSSPNVLSAGAVERVFFQSCFYEPAERTMGVLVVFFQVVAGAVASFLVGMIWFSPVTFGRIWWRYQFPGKRFGEVEKCSNYPLYCTSVALVIQSAVLTFLTDTLLLAVDPFVLDSLPALGFPLLGAVAITMVVSCASLPHYLFAGRPLPLFLVCSSHDTAQIAAAVFVIYALA